MKRNIATIVVCASLGMAAATALAGNPPEQPKPTRAEVQQKAMQDGPATMQPGYPTHKDPVTHHPAGTVKPKLMKPLTQRELGMLLNACAAYAECRTSYDQARERYDAQLRAKAAAAKQD
ncbi:MAG: hypothetical protein ACREP2_06825 [Rhodanobacteraceae bacterium]